MGIRKHGAADCFFAGIFPCFLFFLIFLILIREPGYQGT